MLLRKEGSVLTAVCVVSMIVVKGSGRVIVFRLFEP
jgi:hypothetical protein